uniref:C3H1-type domain-containing protein n=1 Tax=Syphacia muris TaxID=451379 RepID=A0A0N5ADH9_9BILA
LDVVNDRNFSSVDDAPNSEVGFAVNLSHNDITSFQSSQHQGCGNQKLPLNKRPLSSFSNKLVYYVMCKGWLEMGGCGFGQNCRFAHGEEELRPSKYVIPVDNPKYKTKLCDKYTRTGVCPYGDRCLFIHPETANSNGFANPYIHPDRVSTVCSIFSLHSVTDDANNEGQSFSADVVKAALASPLTANSFSSSKASSDSGTEFDSDLMWGFTTGIDDPFELAIKSDNIARSLAIEFAKPF